jgi:uncharacterized protein (TIGR02594 family)
MPGVPAVRYQVLASGLRLRADSGLDAKILRTVRRGARLTRLADSADGKWMKVRHDRQVGWVAAKYVQPVPASARKAKYRWFDIARGELGVQEIAGPGSNPRIVEYLRSTTLDAHTASLDETPWCSAFVNWCVERAEFAGTDSAAARSWLAWGKAARSPSIGCVVVLRRLVNSGHVGFFVSATTTTIRLLGGNQGDRVSERDFPRSDLLGFRVPG